MGSQTHLVFTALSALVLGSACGTQRHDLSGFKQRQHRDQRDQQHLSDGTAPETSKRTESNGQVTGTIHETDQSPATPPPNTTPTDPQMPTGYEVDQKSGLCQLPQGGGLALLGWGGVASRPIDFSSVIKECQFTSKYVLCANGPDVTTGAQTILGCAAYAGSNAEDHARCQADAAAMSRAKAGEAQPTQIVCVQTGEAVTPVPTEVLLGAPELAE